MFVAVGRIQVTVKRVLFCSEIFWCVFQQQQIKKENYFTGYFVSLSENIDNRFENIFYENFSNNSLFKLIILRFLRFISGSMSSVYWIDFKANFWQNYM